MEINCYPRKLYLLYVILLLPNNSNQIKKASSKICSWCLFVEYCKLCIDLDRRFSMSALTVHLYCLCLNSCRARGSNLHAGMSDPKHDRDSDRESLTDWTLVDRDETPEDTNGDDPGHEGKNYRKTFWIWCMSSCAIHVTL